MPANPRLPVVVGVGQSVRKPSGSIAGLPSPPEMMAEVLRRAAADSGAGESLLARADSLQVVEVGSWRAPDPAAVVAGILGIEPRERVRTTTGGNSPQMLVNTAGRAIAGGDLDVALITGAEAFYSRRVAAQTGEQTGWPRQDDTAAPTRVLGDGRPGASDFEIQRSMVVPSQVYPIFECALRARNGATVEEHQVRTSELWARFSGVAAGNPYAWSREPRTALEIRTPGPDNRMIAFPYPKLMNSNIQVDQAAGLIVCSVEAALAAGADPDRFVYLHAGADATDHWYVSERWSLAGSPAIAACGRHVLGMGGVTIDDVARLDLYSCFPSAVEVTALELGVDAWDASRVPTVTGGLGFAGGPLNNYVTHSIATMVDCLRRDPDGAYGLVTANGWFLTKHSLGLYSNRPPDAGFRWASGQPDVDASPRRTPAIDFEGPVTIEAYTVLHERDGSPQIGIVAGLLDDGRRTWANSRDRDLLTAMVTDDLVGVRADVVDGGANIRSGT